MANNDIYVDEYEMYEERFNPLRVDRQARRKRKPRVKHNPKKSQDKIINEIADTVGLEGGFETTYKPSRYEAEWLLQSLRTFYDQAIITDVLALVKGGKEANVYRCAAHPSTGVEVLAAKVYRPHIFRQIRNDRVYRQGREILTGNGRPVQGRDQRIIRAVGKKSTFGRQVSHTSWLMYEYTSIQKLYQTGAAVPQPFGAGENAVLMSYHGDERLSAPTLNEVSLESDEAGRLFTETLRNIELMLQHDLVHGDLSAYNILYWESEITIIDFPQVVNVHNNDSAYTILQRDIERICDYFSRQGVESDPDAITDELWRHYAGATPDERAREQVQLMLDE